MLHQRQHARACTCRQQVEMLHWINLLCANCANEWIVCKLHLYMCMCAPVCVCGCVLSYRTACTWKNFYSLICFINLQEKEVKSVKWKVYRLEIYCCFCCNCMFACVYMRFVQSHRHKVCLNLIRAHMVWGYLHTHSKCSKYMATPLHKTFKVWWFQLNACDFRCWLRISTMKLKDFESTYA